MCSLPDVIEHCGVRALLTLNIGQENVLASGDNIEGARLPKEETNNGFHQTNPFEHY